MSDLRRLFEPHSIALVGVSREPSKMSHWLIRNVAEVGFPGAVYPISPSGGEILGYRTYPSLSALPEPVDLVLVSVASKAVKEVVQEAAKNKAGAAVILSSGFGEIRDESGKALEEEILEIARDNGLRIMGPNCLGIYNAHRNLNGTYFATTPKFKGKISVVSQSGAYGGVLVNEMNARGIGLGKLASIGNQMDVRHQEVMEYFCRDEDTDVIGVFVEGVKDGPDFLSVVKRVSKIKPVVIFKGGRTSVGRRAAASHTGSLAGDFAIAEAAFRQAGALFAHTTEDFFDYLFALAYNHHRLPKDGRLAIVTISGGPCVTASDYCEEIGLIVPQLSDGTREKIRKFVPFFAADSNPVDMTVGTLPENLGPCVDAILGDPDLGGGIAINWGWDVEEFAQAFVDAAEKRRKPVLAFVSENPRVQEIFRERGILNFPAPERAVRGYWGLVRYREVRENQGTEKRFNTTPSRRLSETGAGEATTLDEYLSKELLREYGMPTCTEAVVHSGEQLTQRAREIGYPVVLKVLSSRITHKTEQGGVVLEIVDESALLSAFEQMRKRFPAGTPFLVQECVRPGTEVIVGIKRDPTFGPVLAFGLGGVFTEVIRDISLRVCPLSLDDARAMIREIKGYPLLKGYRGKPPVDEEGLAEILLRVSELAVLNDRIQELDINPIILNGADMKAVDALVVLASHGT